ncbi:MAG: P27 family phage terminase small subunit [Cyanobacteria bacterium SZAS-4]|nr:P27 family phage terminase small subunit [Cyanobacteria bacterium SZAS-4]
MSESEWDLINELSHELKGDALNEWRRVAPVLYQRGIITRLDARHLSHYCNQYALLIGFERSVKEAEERADKISKSVYQTLSGMKSSVKRYCKSMFCGVDESGRLDLSNNAKSARRVRVEQSRQK